jgi:hypothetical protein
MRSTARDIICNINERLCAGIAGSMFYGVAISIAREGKYSPHVDERPVGIDDSHKISGYHKFLEITPRTTGFTILNQYACALIVHNTTSVPDDELAEQLQSIINTFDRTTTVTRILLNSEAIWSTEYRGVPYNGARLIQLNYTLLAARREDCCETGDCLTSKTT